MRTTRSPSVHALRAAAASAAIVLALAAPTPRADAAGLLVADGGLGGVLEIESHDVAVTINDGIAVTEVTQVFRNTEDRQVEALYTFPVPKGASVSEFNMWIGGREMVGEVVERDRARQIYESYKRRNIDPGLLEQVDYRTFEMRIFPIAARAEQRVRIVYYQQLEVDNDWATYVYPLATDTRRDVDSRTTGRFSLNLTAKSSVPIVEFESPSHGDDFVNVKHAPDLVQASLEATGGDLNRDLVLAYRVVRPQSGVDIVASKEPGEDGYFLLTLTAGDELGNEQGGMDYVFVLDTSGSMKNDGKLQVSRGSVDAFIRSLGPEDRFEVVAFNVAANPLFQNLLAADDGAKDAAAAFLEQQRPRGGTSLDPAIRAAYEHKNADRQLNVVILSDGMTEQAERASLLQLIGQRPAGTRVFAIGVGNDVDRPLLEQIAEDAGGLAAFVSRGDDFERQAAAFRRKLLRPAVTNLSITADGGEFFDVEPKQLPNLYHGMPVRMYGRYSGKNPVSVTVRGDLDGGVFEQTLSVTLDGSADANPEIERMWALHVVRRLLRDADRAGSRESVREEVVRLGEGYSIVTPFTSFLVLESDAEYQRWKIERRNATRVLRDRAARQRLNERLADMRTADAREIGPLDPATAPQRTTAQRAPTAANPPARNSGRDLDFGGGGGGGGALDPFSVFIVLGLAGGAAATRRRRRDGEED